MLRVYNESTPERVRSFYEDQHRSLTYSVGLHFLARLHSKPTSPHSICHLLALCDSIYDPSDPDTNLSQTEHAFQVALAARDSGLPEEYVAVGLVHDLGKAVHTTLGIDMKYLVGDIYPLGCPYEYEHIVYGDSLLQNPDVDDTLLSTGTGMYSPRVGFDHMIFVGHDEVIYQALCKTEHRLSDEALYVLRYHSFYPWHQHGAYSLYASAKDRERLPLLQAFQKLDLYTKPAQPVSTTDRESILSIVSKYLPYGIQMW